GKRGRSPRGAASQLRACCDRVCPHLRGAAGAHRGSHHRYARADRGHTFPPRSGTPLRGLEPPFCFFRATTDGVGAATGDCHGRVLLELLVVVEGTEPALERCSPATRMNLERD